MKPHAHKIFFQIALVMSLAVAGLAWSNDSPTRFLIIADSPHGPVAYWWPPAEKVSPDGETIKASAEYSDAAYAVEWPPSYGDDDDSPLISLIDFGESLVDDLSDEKLWPVEKQFVVASPFEEALQLLAEQGLINTLSQYKNEIIEREGVITGDRASFEFLLESYPTALESVIVSFDGLEKYSAEALKFEWPPSKDEKLGNLIVPIPKEFGKEWERIDVSLERVIEGDAEPFVDTETIESVWGSILAPEMPVLAPDIAADIISGTSTWSSN